MINSILRCLFGTLDIKISGGIERFIDIARKNGINLGNVKINSSGEAVFTVYRRTFLKLRPVIRRSHVKIHIVARHGMPHLLQNYRHRYGLAIGAAAILVMIYVSSLFIWDIKIDGCQSVSKEEVLDRLSESGLSAGRAKSGIVAREIENVFLKNYGKVSWISINIKGTTAYVELRENGDKPQKIDTSQPSSIYASRDGVIASVDDYMGYSMVRPGDTVSAGDLIVSGNYTDRYGVEYKLHSYAKVMAYTVHSKNVSVPLKYVEHLPTGRKKKKYTLKLISFELPLYFNKKIMYNDFDITKSEKKLKITDSFVIPVSILKTTYTEVEKCECARLEQTARNDAYEQLHDYEYSLVGIRILDRKYTESIDGDSLTVNAEFECYEDIGVSAAIN